MNVAVEQYEGTKFQLDWELLEAVQDLIEAKGPGSEFDWWVKNLFFEKKKHERDNFSILTHFSNKASRSLSRDSILFGLSGLNSNFFQLQPPGNHIKWS